ncbi:hypothetical protein D3C85_721150 [compost metagenome]
MFWAKFGALAGRQRQGQHGAALGGIDDAVIPQPCAGVVGVTLLFILGDHRRAYGLGLLLAQAFSLGRQLVAAHLHQHPGRLLAPHHRDAAVGPAEQEVGLIGAAAHAVVAGAEAAADDQGQLGHPAAGHGGDQLGAVLGDALFLRRTAHHKAGDVLQEQQGNSTLVAELDEVGALLGAVAVQHAVVGEDPHRHAADAGEAGDQRGAEQRLEFVKLGAIHQAGDELPGVIGALEAGAHQAVELLYGVEGLIVAWC